MDTEEKEIIADCTLQNIYEDKHICVIIDITGKEYLYKDAKEINIMKNVQQLSQKTILY